MSDAAANQAERKRWNDPFWSEVWPKRERFTETVTPLLLRALGLKAGERVLDIGCGGGPATTAAAHAVGSTGRAIGADISIPLVELARRRIAAAGLKNVSFEVKDVQQDRVDGAPFDVAMSQFGVMFFDEPKTAFANIRGHLTPAGRLAFACWQPVARNPWFVGPTLKDFVPPPPPPAPGKSPTGPFVFGDADYVRGILQAAGFTEIAVALHEYPVEGPENAIIDDAQLSFLGVPPEKMAQARAAVDQHMARFRLPSGVCRFPLAVQIFTARTATG
ncbi:MAG TPA: class I SAM-dependent methyltransferase [Stellaceae bacterium]|nr:class I SAM-dependent methyltransferase [Stellaceae bacterium]